MTVSELIERLRRFPQNANISIFRDNISEEMFISVEVGMRLFDVDCPDEAMPADWERSTDRMGNGGMIMDPLAKCLKMIDRGVWDDYDATNHLIDRGQDTPENREAVKEAFQALQERECERRMLHGCD